MSAGLPGPSGVTPIWEEPVRGFYTDPGDFVALSGLDLFRNALAETTIGPYKTECIRDGSPFRTGPLETVADVEEITSQWVHWYNTSRLMHRLGRRPPAEAEAEYYRAWPTTRSRHTRDEACMKPGGDSRKRVDRFGGIATP